MKISGNTILITGGGSGIGRGLAELFQKEGNQVIIAGRRRDVLDETVKANPGMQAEELDLSSAESIREFAARVTEKYPELNAVLHNAGTMKMEDLKDGSTEVADGTIATNLVGTIQLNSALLPHILKQDAGAVLTVTSGLAFVPLALAPAYCATKAALHSYTESLRYQLKDTAVQVLEIAPPYVQTELGGDQQKNDPAAMPLQDFLTETFAILRDRPDETEVLVDRVKPLRYAAQNGDYAAFFQRFNDGFAAAHAND